MATDPEVAVTLASAIDCRHHMDEVCALYDEAFSVAPFVWPDGESARHRNMLERLTLDPTFGIALAEIASDLVGFVYGFALKSDTNWWDGFQQPVPAELTREWPDRTFAVIDLAVRSDHRRHGLGKHLLDTLLVSRAEERATLAVQPQSAESHAFYAAIGGWRLIGRQDTPGFVSSQFDIYVSELTSP